MSSGWYPVLTRSLPPTPLDPQILGTAPLCGSASGNPTTCCKRVLGVAWEAEEDEGF